LPLRKAACSLLKRLATYFFLVFALSLRFLSASAQERLNRDSADYYFQRGASFYEDHSGRVPKARLDTWRRSAMSNYTKSIAFDSTFYWSYRNRGYCHEKFGEVELALADYNHAVQAGERSGEADAAHVHFNCLSLCLRLQRWAEAEAHCSAVLTNPHLCASETDTYCRSIWLHRADARVNLKKYPEAKRDYVSYQQQTAAELAVAQQQLALEQQQLARTKAKEKALHLSKEERASLAEWGEGPKKQPPPVEKLVQENQVVTAKLAELEKLMK
jgi:tetratricopeptide (TPR) repeat protein